MPTEFWWIVGTLLVFAMMGGALGYRCGQLDERWAWREGKRKKYWASEGMPFSRARSTEKNEVFFAKKHRWRRRDHLKLVDPDETH